MSPLGQLLLVLLAWATLAACAELPQPPNSPPVYVVLAPLCLLACGTSLGNVREEVTGGTGGAHSLALTTSAGAGRGQQP